MTRSGILLLLSFVCVFPMRAQFLKDKEKSTFSGFFQFHYVEGEDKIYLEVKELEKEFLYVHALSEGLGSNDIGLDRGQLGSEQVVFFRKAGNKLILIQPNMTYRANTDNPLEKVAVEQAFAKSVLYGFPIKEQSQNTYLIDITPFLLQDMHGVSRRLKSTKQGTYKLDKDRSALSLLRTKAFPHNVEFEALLTFNGEPEGEEVRSVTPNAEWVSVMQHHSFIMLPDKEYVPREFDPRSGCYPLTFMDYATSIQDPIGKKLITRHRLRKKFPDAPVSEAVEPIIYYLDNGTPEPVRSALMEGAQWWNEAFESIGFKNAFQVKPLPPDADPLDVRYNVIQWVHRSTRGWSYGNSITDPRTGEIIKGHVSLGSLRIRQDYLIAQALMNEPFIADSTDYRPMLEFALARIRQLAAHEVGHTLGFAHNYVASINDRSSVMDYPHPMLSVREEKIDFYNAYDKGIGEWDKVSVAYAYSEIDENNRRVLLEDILQGAQKKGLRYITDQDSRPVGGAHPYAHLWDNGANATDELENILKVRELAMKSFSDRNIRMGDPYSVLEDVFVPLYFLHRYQTEAVVKSIGGLDYNYALRGDGQLIWKPVPNAEQQKALSELLITLTPTVLRIPDPLLSLFPPRSFGYPRTRESFKGNTGVAFDALGAAATSADMTLQLLLNPERASRLVQQRAMDPSLMGLDRVLDQVLENFKRNYSDGLDQEINNTVGFIVLDRLIELALTDKAYPQVNAIAKQKLKEIKIWISKQKVSGLRASYFEEYMRKIDVFENHPDKHKTIETPKIPDGAPIGMDCIYYNLN